MDELDLKAIDTVKKIERYERNWHVLKAVLLAIGVITIILFQFYTFHRLYTNSDKNRQLLRCTVTTLTIPDSNAETFRTQLNDCLLRTR